MINILIIAFLVVVAYLAVGFLLVGAVNVYGRGSNTTVDRPEDVTLIVSLWLPAVLAIVIILILAGVHYLWECIRDR